MNRNKYYKTLAKKNISADKAAETTKIASNKKHKDRKNKCLVSGYQAGLVKYEEIKECTNIVSAEEYDYPNLCLKKTAVKKVCDGLI